MTYGLYMAVVSIAIALIVWSGNLMIKLGLMGNVLISLLNFAVMLILLVVFTKAFRDQFLGGRIKYLRAFTFGVAVVVYSSVLTAIYNYVFLNFIDPGYLDRVMEAMQEKTYNMLLNLGAGEDQIDEAMTQFEKREQVTPFQFLQQSLASGLIGGSVMSLISSAIVKKNPNKSSDPFEKAMSEIEE